MYIATKLLKKESWGKGVGHTLCITKNCLYKILPFCRRTKRNAKTLNKLAKTVFGDSLSVQKKTKSNVVTKESKIAYLYISI